jgi:hypothetical protein
VSGYSFDIEKRTDRLPSCVLGLARLPIPGRRKGKVSTYETRSSPERRSLLHLTK